MTMGVMAMTMMTAIAIRAPGDPDVLMPEQRPIPVPGPRQLLLKVHAAGVNRPDVLQRRGLYPPPPGASDIPGLEAAGVVVAVGQGVTRYDIGSRVCALLSGGGYATYALAEEGSALPVPKDWSYAEAASVPETVFTVWSNLFERAFTADGDSVLVHGGSSGIGTTAIILGKEFGLTVYVTAGSDAKCKACLDLGADAAINYKIQDFAEEVKKLTGGSGVDVVLDMVGGNYVPRNLACMKEGGRHVSIAVQGGAMAEVNLFDIMRRRLTLTGSTLRAREPEIKAMIAASLEEMVWPVFDAGRCKPVIDSHFPLEQAAAAHARMESGDHIGKIVLLTSA
jgi:NADPH:quinone reductase